MLSIKHEGEYILVRLDFLKFSKNSNFENHNNQICKIIMYEMHLKLIFLQMKYFNFSYMFRLCTTRKIFSCLI